jgi:ribosomal protein S18 acetylase RimI-like enzyme
MSEIIIRSFIDSDLEQVREIFFESSIRKNFKDQVEKDFFEWKYLGFYLHHYPTFCFVAELQGKILGYVVGATETWTDEFIKLQPHLESFKSYLPQYPAHLHINCHADSRGRGVGSMLVRRIMAEFNCRPASGVHIMTGIDSSNREFYRKLGFDFEVLENFNGHPLILMGKKLRV